MESTRRFKRPRNVFRALLGPADGNAAPAIDAAAQEAPLPHLSLVTEAAIASDNLPGDGAGSTHEPEHEGEPPKGKGRGKLILFGLLLVVVAAGSGYAVYETRTS